MSDVLSSDDLIGFCGLMTRSNEKKRERGESESNQRQGERENITKILNASAIITVHIYTVTVVIVHLCTILHPLMWVFF